MLLGAGGGQPVPVTCLSVSLSLSVSLLLTVSLDFVLDNEESLSDLEPGKDVVGL